MKTALKFIASACFACGVAALAPGASAMPAANVGAVAAPAAAQAHAVRVCDRWGRCWWSYAGHGHGGAYAWRRPYYGWHGGRYGYGWHGGGWHGGRYGHGWHGGHRHWR